MLKLLKCNGLSLKYASDELKNDKDIVLEAITNNNLSLKYASDELQTYYAQLGFNITYYNYLKNNNNNKIYELE